jgi:hypothetical protein
MAHKKQHPASILQRGVHVVKRDFTERLTTAKFVNFRVISGKFGKKPAAERKVPSDRCKISGRTEVKLTANPANLDEHEIGKRLYVLVIYRTAFAY